MKKLFVLFVMLFISSSCTFADFTFFSDDWYSPSYDTYSNINRFNSLNRAKARNYYNSKAQNYNHNHRKFNRFRGVPTGYTPPVNTHFRPSYVPYGYYDKTPDWENSSTNAGMRIKILD